MRLLASSFPFADGAKSVDATVVGFAARANVKSDAMVMAMKGDCQAAIIN